MKSYKYSDKGKFRKNNEDSIFASTHKVNKLDNLFIVCDGVGGNKAGDVASKKAIEFFIKNIKNSNKIDLNRNSEIKSYLSNALTYASNKINLLEKTNEKYSNMCTTLIALTIHNNKMHAISVGDSRIYMITIKNNTNENGEEVETKSIVQITQDDAQIIEQVIKPKEINFGSSKANTVSSNNVRRRKVLTKAVGITKDVTGNYYEIDLSKKLNDTNKIYFVLCSDGLYDGLNDEDILSVINTNKKFSNKAKTLVKESIKKGSRDNVSTIVVEL